MNAAVRALLTAITVAALSILILTAPAAAGVPAPGEQPPHLAATERPTLPHSGRGAQFDRDEFAPATGSQPTTTSDDYALAPSIPALAVTLLGLSLMIVRAGSTRRRRRRPPAAA
jgi:hypothetical protein